MCQIKGTTENLYTMIKKLYITKDLKGIKMTWTIKHLVNRINNGDVCTYDLRLANGEEWDAYVEIAYFAIKNSYRTSIYCESDTCKDVYSFKHIAYFLSDIFNSTITDAERFMRGMAYYSGRSEKIYHSESCGLDYFEVR